MSEYARPALRARRCETCSAWSRTDELEGECRRRAPALDAAAQEAMAARWDTGEPPDPQTGAWPTTLRHLWRLEWVSDPAAEATEEVSDG